MGVLGTYCFDGLNFSQATALYTNSALSVLATDGYYSQGGIVRQQLSGVLLNTQSCSNCSTELSLCFSAVSADELCCGTATPVSVWINSSYTFTTAPDLFTTSAMSTRVLAGWYSDDLAAGCAVPVPATTYTISKCNSDPIELYTVEDDFTFSLNDVVQFQVGVPPSGTLYCGTVTNIDSGGTADATLFSGQSYECGDIVHCDIIV